MEKKIRELDLDLKGEVSTDQTTRILYSTDASVYQQFPLAVAFPKDDSDIRRLILFAQENQVGLIPRTAGTSLAGQVVGDGMVVDVSRYMTKILEVNEEQQWVRVQPGVIRNELNMSLLSFGMVFGPETSTANRAMIGGMLGNNSAGSNSIVYGSTRDQTIAVKGVLSDGSYVSFGPLTAEQFETECSSNIDDLQHRIYRESRRLLTGKEVQSRIKNAFPKPEIHRRNTGYAIDCLIDCDVFGGSDRPLNFCKLIAGSEGTLFFVTEIKLHCHRLPPEQRVLLCAHFDTVDEALRATQITLEHQPYACELIDRRILEGAARNLEQKKNCEFVVGDPGAILLIKFCGHERSQVEKSAAAVESALRQAKLGYAYVRLFDNDSNKAWSLRRAGLGVIANVAGDTKPTTVIEDTAVATADLPAFIGEVDALLHSKYQASCVHYAHAGAGEIHLRPLLNLKTEKGRSDFQNIASDVADIVKKYKGSLSGEHGDGRLRSEFLERMVGHENYQLMHDLKMLWDPNSIFNPGKIVDAVSMGTSLRADLHGQSPSAAQDDIETVFNFSKSLGIVRAAEMCSGSGDCRKTHLSGGTMCPSYMATRNEKDSTRARANLLRHALTHPVDSAQPFNHEEARRILDLCLSCKACKSECPSNVDMARLKAEFMQGYYDANGVPLRTRLVARFASFAKWAAVAPRLVNFLNRNAITSRVAKRIAGIHPLRSIPPFGKQSLRRWIRKRKKSALDSVPAKGRVFLFCDEFTNYLEPETGIATIELLERLGWNVEVLEHEESGRASLSNGLVRHAKQFADTNVKIFSEVVSQDEPLIGIEPSALLVFRDEYPDLVDNGLRTKAAELATNTFLIDEFLARMVNAGEILPSQFTDQTKRIRLHGHCHQKALSSISATKKMLSLPENYTVETIRSGCCGMAGSFGLEKEHYEISTQIGELVLFPTIRAMTPNEVIAAPGTSCRHQILDGTGRVALHPVQILRDALCESCPIKPQTNGAIPGKT